MKLFMIIVWLAGSLYAGSAKEAAGMLGAETDYRIAIDKAAREKNIVVMVVVKKNCRWCNKLLYGTLSNPEVKKALHRTVLLVVDRSDAFPKRFRETLFPSVFYVDPHSRKSLYENVGYVKKEAFLRDLDEAFKIRSALYAPESQGGEDG